MTKRPSRKSKHRGKRAKSSPIQSAGDRFLLDAFSTLDLKAWKAAGDTTIEFEVRRYHELEALRQLYKRQLIDALSSVQAATLEIDHWCRIVDYRYSHHPLSASGSLKRGGRFNIGGDCDRCSSERFAALYLAEDHDTAMCEKFGLEDKSSGFASEELALRKKASYSHVRVKGQVRRVFRLGEPKRLKCFTDVIREFRLPSDVIELGREVGIEPPHLVSSPKELQVTLHARDWRYLPSNYGLPANSQVFAALVKESGFEGIVYNSIRGGGRCLALFPDMLAHSDSWLSLSDKPPKGVTLETLNGDTWKQVI